MQDDIDIDIDEGQVREQLKFRENFRRQLLQNPNFFGTVDDSKFQAVFPLKGSTAFERLGCIGLQPQTDRLEAVVYVNQSSGYGGGLCGPGSTEYVRFYASDDGGRSWDDLGLSSFTAWDVPRDGRRRRLEYAVTRRHNFRQRICLKPRIVLVRGILSWNVPPPPNSPNHVPVWGNRHDTRVLVEPLRRWLIGDILSAAQAKFTPELAQAVDATAAINVTPKALSLDALKALYKGQEVPAKRFAHPQLQALVDKGGLSAALPQLGLGDIDLGDLFGVGDGNTGFEELECIGYNPDEDSLAGVIRIKRAAGFSGGPCTRGSQEHVTFWADLDGNGSFETCLGTASVRVWDIADIPREGLEFAVHLPAELLRQRIPCNKGPRLIPIRAILSWATPMPCATPDRTPTWGNRLETLIHIRPGPVIGAVEPLLSSVGGIPVNKIDGDGLAQDATAITTGNYFNEAPFGGRINLGGKIVGGTPGTRYRPMIRPSGAGAFVPLSLIDGIAISIVTPGPVITQTTLMPGADGYFDYQDYSANHYVESNILARWDTGSGEHGKKYDLRIDIQNGANPDIQSNVVTVEIDNRAPVLSLDFTTLAGDCAHFDENAVFNGTFSVTDSHFGGYSFSILPPGPANGVLSAPPSGRSVFLGGAIADPGVPVGTGFTLNTAGMAPCGYALVLTATDRTNVNSGAGNNLSQDSVGFCLGSPPQG